MDECRRRPWNHRQRKSVCPDASATQWCFSICLAKTSQRTSLSRRRLPVLHFPQPSFARPPKKQGGIQDVLYADWNAFWMWRERGTKKNETETEWTLCRWILVKDASRVCDSVINLVKLRTEEPRQQNQRLLTEKRTQRSHFFAVPQNLKCIQMDSGGTNGIHHMNGDVLP